MIKQADLKLISALRKNARESLTTISRNSRIPISTLFDRLKQQEGSIIMKHTTLLDFAKLGYNCRANLLLGVEREQRDKLISYLKAHPAINNLFKINNGFDLMAEVVFNNVKELEEFYEEMEKTFKINEKKTFYVIDDIKREAFMFG